MLDHHPSRRRIPCFAVRPAFKEVHDVDAELIARRFGDPAGGRVIRYRLRPGALLIMPHAPKLESGSLGRRVRQFPGQRDRTFAIRPRLHRLAVVSKGKGLSSFTDDPAERQQWSSANYLS